MSFLRNRKQTRWINDDEWACTRHLPAARYPASVEECLLSCGNVRPEKPKHALKPAKQKDVKPVTVVKPSAASSKWKDFNQVPSEELMTLRIKDLREYAVHVLRISGAAHIRGGKPKLVERIIEVRKAS